MAITEMEATELHMRKLVAILLLLLFSSAANAQPDIVGRWKSDAERTMQYNTAHALLADKKLKFLSQLMGRLNLTISGKTVNSDLASFEIELSSGEKRTFVGSNETLPYRLLGRSQNSVAILSPQISGGPDAITVFNFDGADVMWVYAGGADKPFPDEHFREYFVRVR
jgi:hypothetical protein